MNNPVTAVPSFLDYEKSLACIHCGLCLSSCPTYLETGNENDSPRGRIYLMRALQSGRLPLGPTSVRHIDLCLGCRACEAVCPSGVQYGALLETTRDHIERHYRRAPWQSFLRRIVIERIFPHSSRMKVAILPARLLRRLGAHRWLPGFARRTLALLPETLGHTPLPAHSSATGPKRGTVGMIRGCVMDILMNRTNHATVRLLNGAGFDVVTPSAQGCCGALHAHSGSLDNARKCARHNIEVFEHHAVDAIIINAAGCGSTLKEYGHLLHDDPAWAERGERFAQKVRDLTEWLASHPHPIAANTDSIAETPSRVTYHDACHLAHPQRITSEPRALVRAVAGDRFVELPESDVCCGSAGSYNLTEPGMAQRLAKRKAANILSTGANVVVTTNPGCMLQIQAALREAGSDVQVVHIADYLDR